MRREDPDKQERAIPPFVMANFVPGGKFVVVLYTDGQIDLNEIKIESGGKWDLQRVAQYKQPYPVEFSTLFWSQLLTGTRLGRPLVAYVDRSRESLQVFLVDHVAGTIEQKQVVKPVCVRLYNVYDIHARGNVILCLCGHNLGLGITVSELGPDPAVRFFTLSVDGIPRPELRELLFFMVSENAVVTCDTKGIHLYHIPELSSMESPSVLNPVWNWLGESKWFCGSVCTTSSHYPMLYLQGVSGTHTITFRLDACGRDPVIVKHHITGNLPAHLTFLERGRWAHQFVIRGRKGLYYNIDVQGDSYPGWATCLLGREELAGGFSANVELPEDCVWEKHEAKLADFDERTGRILIGTHPSGINNRGRSTRIYLADLPP